MNTYVTGSTIKTLREAQALTQAELAHRLGVTPKAVSKWETGRGLPDISLLQPLARELGVSVIELMRGSPVQNRNRAAHLLRSKLYVCPVCGNILHATGEATVSCCGITLPPLEGEGSDENHVLTVEPVENEWFVSIDHPMNKEHFISFLALATCDRLSLVKLYPEGEAQTRLPRQSGVLYWYCNRHGLFSQKI